jgi:hypothetical protein
MAITSRFHIDQSTNIAPWILNSVMIPSTQSEFLPILYWPHTTLCSRSRYRAQCACSPQTSVLLACTTRQPIADGEKLHCSEPQSSTIELFFHSRRNLKPPACPLSTEQESCLLVWTSTACECYSVSLVTKAADNQISL